MIPNNSSNNNYEVDYDLIKDNSLPKEYNKLFKESFKKIR